MIDGACIFDDVSDGAHRLIGKSLKPEDARKRGSSRQSLVMLKGDGVRSASGDDRAAKHTLDVAPRIGLVSQVMQRKPDRSSCLAARLLNLLASASARRCSPLLARNAQRPRSARN